MKELVIGSRGSKLALWQAQAVARSIESANPDVSVRIEKIRTKGDHISDVPLAKIGGKGLFVKEIEEALLEGRVDLAVHSLKDVPDLVPEGLTLAAFLKRDSPFDALVSERFATLAGLPGGARVGTSSLRRKCQLLAKRPDLDILPLRGNVDTRLRKLSEGLDAVVLASAGLIRLGLADRITEILRPPDFIPAVGQGVVAVECREEDGWVRKILEALDDRGTRLQVIAERAFLKEIGGGCQVPLGANAQLLEGQIRIIGFIGTPDGKRVIRDEIIAEEKSAEEVGRELAQRLLRAGGKDILRWLEEHPPWGK